MTAAEKLSEASLRQKQTSRRIRAMSALPPEGSFVDSPMAYIKASV
jgi:hypothetical protein